MSLNRLLFVILKNNNNFIKRNTILNIKRFISNTNVLNIKLNRNLLGHHNDHHNSSSKSDIDEKLISKLAAEDPLTDKSELDKHEWERKTKDRVYYGFSVTDPELDKYIMHFVAFSVISILTFLIGFIVYYIPDYKYQDWSYREAHLELSRRKKLGLPLVSPDYVPVEKITLPSEEEIGDFEIKL